MVGVKQISGSTITLENSLYKITFDKEGHISNILNKDTNELRPVEIKVTLLVNYTK